MASRICIICDSAELETLSSNVGQRAYCHSCFHGWRLDRPEYAYSNTAMCSLGTSKARLETQIGFFGPFCPDSATILEIGCATGELAEATRGRLSVERYEAIELSPAGKQAESRVDRLYTAPLRQLLADGEIQARYDLILMSHVLEHIDDPAAELAAMKVVLKPGGTIFLEVPNLGGNRRLPIDDNRSHYHFFSPTSLAWLLARNGLQTVAAATDVRLDARYADSLQVVARPFHVPTWSRTLLSDHPALNGETEIVVWGAGSLADELLANYFDPARIAFFVDRDPAKKGALCLGRPIHDPDALGSSPRTVLINSIDFADAIAADIAQVSQGASHRLIRISDLLE